MSKKEEIYKKMCEFLEESKFFKRGDERTRVHLAYRDCNECDFNGGDGECEFFIDSHSLRFDAVYEYLLDAILSVNNITKNQDKVMKSLKNSKTFDNLFDEMYKKVNNDVHLYNKIHSLDFECDPNMCEFEDCKAHKEMMKAIWPVFLD